MKIGGIQKVSLIDYPGEVGAIVFTQGCNLRCPYCHNPELVKPELFRAVLGEQDVLSLLRDRRRYLSAVTVTGGEPCIQDDLVAFLLTLREMGYLVKLDTNGTHPFVLYEVLKKEAVNYVSMDIKAPPDKYGEIIRVAVDMKNITKSVELIMESGLPYDFRTTVVKSLLEPRDFEKIGALIRDARLHILQRFIPLQTLDPAFAEEKTFSDEEMEEAAGIMRTYVGECRVR